MNADDLRALLNRRPFIPFAIETLDGKLYEVWHPEMALLAARVVALAPPGTPPGTVPDVIHTVSIAAIARVIEDQRASA